MSVEDMEKILLSTFDGLILFLINLSVYNHKLNTSGIYAIGPCQA